MLVSTLIPTLNEEPFIEKCLLSVIQQRLQHDVHLEILVIDGGSKDRTVQIVQEMSIVYDSIRLMSNAAKYQSYALNIGIKSSNGEIVIRLDAHSIYPDNYISALLESQKTSEADNVGGLFVSSPRDGSYGASLVQALTTHWFGVGDALYRLNADAGYVDTVPFGCFKRELFDKIGYFDERLNRNQDYEFNRRIKKAGGRIWLNPAIRVYYYNQASLVKLLKKQFLWEAPYNTYMWYLAPYTFTFRHAVTGLFTFCSIVGAVFAELFYPVRMICYSFGGLYVLLSLVASFQQSLRYRNVRHILFLPVSFFLFHFVHGLGILKGLLLLLLRRAPVQKVKEPWRGYGKYRISVETNLR